MKEIWKPVKDFEEYYEISNLGRLKRKTIFRYCWGHVKKFKVDRIIKPTLDKGYLKIVLSIGGKNRKIKYIHRLVAEAFLPNPNDFKEINHIDNDRSNNRVDNLEWCDRKHNLDHMIKHQEEIRERNEQRIEALENIFYGIEIGYIKNLKQVKDLIDEKLLGDY